MARSNRNYQLLRGLAAPPHRAISSLRLPLPRLAGGALIALAFTLVLVWAMPAVAEAWSGQMLWWMRVLELPGQFASAVPDASEPFALPAPMIDLRLRSVVPVELAVHGVAAVTLWWVAGWLPDHAKPAAYLLRFAVLLHAASVLYFLCWPASFQHSLSGHIAGGLRQSWALVLVTPWLHFFTFYLFPFAAWQDALLTALTVAYLLVLAPLQYAAHAALLSLFGPVLMPLLYMLFGVMIPIMAVVAMYGWGMSWPCTLPVRARD